MNKENLEIERKFLLKKVPKFLAKDVDKFLIHQVYHEINGKIHRFRMTENLRSQDEDRTYIECVKTSISHGVFEEIEKEIGQNKFDRMIKKPHRYIIKERTVYKANGLKWEIDKYHDISLVTLEVELDDIHQKIEVPETIEKEIIAEVTGQQVFSNYNLSEEG